MAEFTEIATGRELKISESETVTCKFKHEDCIIEDGARISCDNAIVIMIELQDRSLKADLLGLNGHFDVTADGYIAKLQSGKYYYIRIVYNIEHPLFLLSKMNESVEIVTNIKKYVDKYVVD